MVGSVFFYFVFVKEKMQFLVDDLLGLFIYLFSLEFGFVYTSLQISVLEGESYTSQHWKWFLN